MKELCDIKYRDAAWASEDGGAVMTLPLWGKEAPMSSLQSVMIPTEGKD
jgi:hypothetical protein